MSLEPQHILCKKYYKSRPLTSVAKVFICCTFKKNNHQTSHLSLPASNIRYACEYIFSNYIKRQINGDTFESIYLEVICDVICNLEILRHI